MKKLFILLAAIIVCAAKMSAWEIGDFYANDPTGVPAVVVYVDDSGEHGLIMSPIAVTQKQYDKLKEKQIDKYSAAFEKKIPKLKKYAIKGGADKDSIDAYYDMMLQNRQKLVDWFDNAPRLYDGKLKEKDERKQIKDLSSEINEYGEDNLKTVVRYCQEENVDMTQYFRQFEYVINLGEGWFVPGNHELELFNKFFAEGMGKDNKVSAFNYDKFMKALDQKIKWSNKMVGYDLIRRPVTRGITITKAFPNSFILSSTMLKSAWTEENKDKTGKAIDTSSILSMIGSAADLDNYYTLMYVESQMLGQWWIFADNWGSGALVVGFKYF